MFYILFHNKHGAKLEEYNLSNKFNAKLDKESWQYIYLVNKIGYVSVNTPNILIYLWFSIQQLGTLFFFLMKFYADSKIFINVYHFLHVTEEHLEYVTLFLI